MSSNPKKLRTPSKFETTSASDRKQWRLIRRLRRSKRAGTDELADILEGCTDDKKCMSGACHVCSRMVRLELLKEAAELLRGALEVHMMTMILSEFLVPEGQLNALDLSRIKQRYERILREFLPSNLMIVGGVDVSLNSRCNAGFHWNVHIHVLVLKVDEGPSISDVKETLRAALKRRSNSDEVKRPLRVEKVKRFQYSKALTYCLKSEFEHRSGYWRTKNLGRRAPHWATRGQRLKVAEDVELRLWLAQWTAIQRLILVGVANPGSPNFVRLRRTSRGAK